MRQDPDIVVIGEIRDNFSAETAVQAALTGHKVLTTFHTEDSIGGLIGAQWLAKKCDFDALSNEGFAAGLLHDVG